jgi:enoyl-CoA hydratase
MLERNDNHVGLEKENNIAIITIDNPPVNALNMHILTAINQYLDKLMEDNKLMALIITGAGEKAFIAGMDINLILNLDEDTARDSILYGQNVMQKIADFPVPTIAAINGAALGGGLELALACDIRLAAVNARLGLPELSLGAIPGFGGTQRLPRMVSLAIASEMLYTGEAIKAEEAYRINLINRVVPAGQVLNEAMQIAGKIATKGPIALRAAKRAISLGLQLPLRDGLTLETELTGQLYGTKDIKEGAKSFLEKRPPVFCGN